MRSYRVSLWRLIRDFLAEAVDFDGRMVRTMRTLFVHPGGLAQAFSDNRRASFVSPVRMYLFSSLLFFFLLAVGDRERLMELRDVEPLNIEVVAIEGGPGPDESGVGASSVRERGGAGVSPAAGGKTTPVTASPAPLYPYLNLRERARLDGLLADPYRPVNHEVIATLGELLVIARTHDEEPSWLVQRSLVNVVSLLDDLPGYVDEIFENLPIAMFVLLPFYALLLKLLFFSSRRFFAEHLVFALYLHVVAYIVFSLSILLPSAEQGVWSMVNSLAGSLAFGYLGVYTYLAMRNYYTGFSGATLESGWSIGWRFLAMGMCYLLLLVPALVLVMAFSFIGL